MKFDIRAILRSLGSRRLATTGLLAWLFLLVIWVIPFEFYGLPAAQLRNIIYSEPFFRLVYALLLVNVLACIALEFPSIIRRTSQMPSADRTPNPGANSLVIDGEWNENRAVHVLEAAGFRRQVVGEGWVWGVRNRFSPWGHVALHLGFFILVAGAVITLDPNAQTVGKAVVVEGETFRTGASEVVDLDPADATVPDLGFTVDDVATRFHKDLLLFTKLDARITDSQGRKHLLRVGSPWFVNPFTTVSIEDYGYAPQVIVSDESSTTAERVFKLKAFPSGTPDYFQIRGLDDQTYNVKVRVYGDYVDRNGQPGVGSFNKRTVKFLVSIWRIRSDQGQTPVTKDVLVGVGQPLEFAGQKLVFTGLREYGFFRINESWSLPIIALGVLVITVGFCVALLVPRQRALIVSRDGEVTLSVRDDVYRQAARTQGKLERIWRSES